MTSRFFPGIGLEGDWDYGEDGWKVGMDYNLFRLSLSVCPRVIAILSLVDDLPDPANEGDVYIVTGAANDDNGFYIYDEGNWAETTPTEGMIVYNLYTKLHMTYEFDKGWFDYWDASKIMTLYESNADRNQYSNAEKSKLAGIEAGATGDLTGSEIKTLYEALTNTNGFTDSEKAKLAGLEPSSFLGVYTGLVGLNVAHPSPVAGSFAFVDEGVGENVVTYIWDGTDSVYVLQGGTSTAETAASIKIKYESNADTNAFTDSEKTKLAGLGGGSGSMTGAEIVTAIDTELGSAVWQGGSGGGGVSPLLTINTYTASQTSLLADGGAYVRMNVATANTFTVPPNATVAHPVGSTITINQAGAGQTTMVAGAGVTLNSPETLKLRKRYSTVSITQVATDVWDVIGDLEV